MDYVWKAIDALLTPGLLAPEMRERLIHANGYEAQCVALNGLMIDLTTATAFNMYPDRVRELPPEKLSVIVHGGNEAAAYVEKLRSQWFEELLHSVKDQ
ncbi:hypothetical protein [Sinomonas sp. P47F7]|uniref:hypothetical protein n=1 Tax=Sinomonas sp. P47F7 TaxID=3410987 RepID=UPI003BF56E88